MRDTPLGLSASALARVREAFVAASYTVRGVKELLGDQAHRALDRNETTPALRRTAAGSPLSTLTRLWPLQAVVGLDEAQAALPGLVEPLCVAGVLEISVGEVRARVDVRPYADDDRDWWIVSDLTPGLDGRERLMRADHVLGVSSASTTLAQLVVREPVGCALDLGTGSGVQSVHLSTHAQRVVATDVNPRCLGLAAVTAALNGIEVDLRLGSLYEPVQAETFDLIVTNPPFVISPGTGERLLYRDSGLPGDEVVRRIVTASADHLRDDGWCHVLANWIRVDGDSWADRLGAWVGETGCDAWVVQRELIDVTQYVEMWLNDAGLLGAPDYTVRYDAWLAWFDAQRVEAVGFGWLSLRKAGRELPQVTIEEWPFEVEQPLGPHVGDWAARLDWLDRLSDADLLTTRLWRAAGVIEERVGDPGDVDPAYIVLRGRHGMRRARHVTTAVAGMVGACDGELTVGQIAAALATLLDQPAALLRSELAVATRSLILDGFLSWE